MFQLPQIQSKEKALLAPVAKQVGKVVDEILNIYNFSTFDWTSRSQTSQDQTSNGTDNDCHFVEEESEESFQTFPDLFESQIETHWEDLQGQMISKDYRRQIQR